MNPASRPPDAAPGGMRGSTRMSDPTEAGHDRVRRWLMNAAFVVILAMSIAHWRWIGLGGADWLHALLLAGAAVPLGLAVKTFELRFKMAGQERRRMLAELPARRKIEFAAYTVLALAAFALQPHRLVWALWGVWLYDFLTYYHDRPERLRHLYAVARTLEELRGFKFPWAWPLPALLLWFITRVAE
jgi:hypothetical protein